MVNVHIVNKIELIKMKNLLIFLSLFLISCGGTRNTDTQQHENIVINNEYKQGEKIVLGNSFIYRPFDNNKPMILDGKKFENAIVSNDKSTVIEKWKTRDILKTITIEKTKLTEKTDNTLLYIGLFLVLIIGVLAWFKLPSFR